MSPARSRRALVFSLGALPALLMLPGCGDHTGKSGHGHGHAGHSHTPPHGGTAVELNESFSLEVVPDFPTGSLKAYVLDGCLEKFIRLPSAGFDVQLRRDGKTNTLRLAPIANPATGETVGDTSLFASAEGTLQSPPSGSGKAFDGVIPTIDVRGNSFSNVSFQFIYSGK